MKGLNFARSLLCGTALVALSVSAQPTKLLLLCGTPDSELYETEVYSVREGSLTPLHRFDTGYDFDKGKARGGLATVWVDYRGRKVYLGMPKGEISRVHIVSMDTGRVEGSVSLQVPDDQSLSWTAWPEPIATRRILSRQERIRKGEQADQGNTLLDTHLATRAGRVLLVGTLAGDRGRSSVEVFLDGGPTAVWTNRSAGLESGLMLSGTYGVLGVGGGDKLPLIVQNGELWFPESSGAVKADLPPLPAEVATATKNEVVWLVGKDRDRVVLQIGRWLLFASQATGGKWLVDEVTADGASVRVVGGWGAGLAIRRSKEPSAGAASWRGGKAKAKKVSEVGKGTRGIIPSRPAMGNVFDDESERGYQYPGVLFLINLDTSMRYQWETGQGDSEILLVEEGTVFYRVNDELFSATLSEGGVRDAKLLAKDDVIRDAHWAFAGK
jgi:hypothetical protein